jgi:hypothetical protein
MIKLFRKIRYDLIEKKASDGRLGNTRKYLKYAIGEIVLVVIGILIALQLNNYNETLSQNNLEQKALHNLKLDFNYNKSELNKAIRELKKSTNTSFSILNQTGNKYEEPFQIDNLLDHTLAIPQYFPQNGFLMDLINSGKLGIINNDKLRNRLSSWLPSLKHLKDREDKLTENTQVIMQFMSANGNWLNIDELATNEEIKILKFPKSGFVIDNNDLLQHLEFENMIENQVVSQSQLLAKHKACIKLAEGVIKLLEEEIKE